MTKKITITALVVAAIGICLMWAGGLAFPFYPPPGALILAAGAVFVAVARWRWVPAVGTALGVFMIVGFLASQAGMDNIDGANGTTVLLGQVVQLVGVVTALVAGSVGTGQSYRRVSA